MSADCASCHSTSFAKLYAEHGGDVTAPSEEELPIGLTDGITCYSCHGDTPGTMVVTKDYIAEAAEEAGIVTSDVDLVCAQCHSHPNRALVDEVGTTEQDLSGGIMGNPNTSTWVTLFAGTDATAAYEWFLEQGIKNPRISVGEMEFEQYYGSVMDLAGATCADCHMESAVAENSTEYTCHAWQGSNVNTALYDNCLTCHTDATAEGMQEQVLALHRRRIRSSAHR